MSSKFNPDRAASLLVEAEFTGDKAVIEKHGVAPKTLYNWRERLGNDLTFTDIYRLKKEAFEREWGGSLAPAIRDGIEFLARAAREADPKNPDVIHAIAGALKILTTTATKKEVLDATLNRRSSSTENGARTTGIPGRDGDSGTGRVAN